MKELGLGKFSTLTTAQLVGMHTTPAIDYKVVM